MASEAENMFYTKIAMAAKLETWTGIFLRELGALR